MDDDEALGDGEESAISTTKDETTTAAGVSSIDGASSVGGAALPSETKTPANHFDFGSIALQLTAIEDFHVCYKVCRLGVKVRNLKVEFKTGGTWC